MPEFLKTIITMVVGVILGIAADPIRSAVMTTIEARKMRRRLYMELASMYQRFSSIGPNLSAQQGWAAECLRSFSCDVYIHAKTKPDVFYSLREAQAFDCVYETYRVLTARQNPGTPKMLDDIRLGHISEDFLQPVDECLKNGTFNLDLFREAYPEYTDHLNERESKKSAEPTSATSE